MMRKYLLMDWMTSFRCIGGECPSTCCAGWRIVVKPLELQKYKELAKQHPFGKDILDAIDEEHGVMMLCNDKCKLLTEEGWCKIVLKCGEEYLSEVCTFFPRMMRQFGDVLECLVEIVCPVVARRLFSDEKISFLLEEIDDGTEEQAGPFDFVLYDALSLGRSCLIDLFQEYDITYSAVKIYILLSTIYMVRDLHGKNQLNKEEMEKYLGRWDEENCNQVFHTVESIVQRTELKVVKVLEIFHMLLSIGALDFLLVSVKNLSVKEDFQRWIVNKEEFGYNLEEYLKWFRKRYSNAFENYFVYALFREWIPDSLKMEQFGKSFFLRVILWCAIHLCALSIWEKREEVTIEEFSVIISSMERTFAHAAPIFDSLVNVLAEEDDIARLLLYLIY